MVGRRRWRTNSKKIGDESTTSARVAGGLDIERRGSDAPAIMLVASPEGSLQKSRPTQPKRARERARLEKQQQKAARRQEQKKGREDRPSGGGNEDPDIAGIVPGPPPSPW